MVGLLVQEDDPARPQFAMTRCRIFAGGPFCQSRLSTLQKTSSSPARRTSRCRGGRDIVRGPEEHGRAPGAVATPPRPRRSPGHGGRQAGEVVVVERVVTDLTGGRLLPGELRAPGRVDADLEEGRGRVRTAKERQDRAADPARPVVERDRDLADGRPAAVERISLADEPEARRLIL